MKRLFFILMSISLVACLYAVPSKKYKFVVKTTDGDFSYALYKQPEMSFTTTDVVISMDQEEVHFSKNDLVEFTLDYNQYQVTFLNWDGDTLQSSMVTYGELPVYNGENPERESNAKYTYTFSGWSPEVDVVTGTASYYAQFSETLNRYEVTFVDWDAIVLKQELVDYGASATAPDNPIREGYDFVGWDTDYSYIISDLTVTAQYEKQVGTSIGSKETETQKSPTKILENGILYIVLPDGTRYNAQGAAL